MAAISVKEPESGIAIAQPSIPEVSDGQVPDSRALRGEENYRLRFTKISKLMKQVNKEVDGSDPSSRI